MNLSMKHLLGSTLVSISLGAFACGTSARVDADLDVPDARDARISITPALDVSGLYDPTLADRIVIDEITVNISDARLLGADPRIPAGGLELLTGDKIVSAYGSEGDSVELPFPEYLLTQDDLAVFVRIDRSDALELSSVVVHGRLYSDRVKGGMSDLAANQDPDGDPARDPSKSDVRDRSPAGFDPEDDLDRHCNQDPDGDPAVPSICSRQHYLVERGEQQASVPIELRGGEVRDLIATLDPTSKLDIIIGIPAARWLTKETVAELEALLAEKKALPASSQQLEHNRDKRSVIVPATTDGKVDASRDRIDEQGDDDYFLSDEFGPNRLKVRR